MKFQLGEGTDSVAEGTKIMLEERGFELSTEGIKIHFICVDNPQLFCCYTKGKLTITSSTRVQYFRMLVTFLCHLEDKKGSETEDYYLEETAYFESNGVMLDCSRNGVLNLKTIKEYIRNLAALGMNALMLYTEDTYEIKEYPYFGAFRGRYSESELRECDDYADLFGIEMIPCIQTLAHLHTPLRWNEFSKLKDTQDILLVGEEEVYHFIECMIQSASAPFRSRRIHLGMDEAHELGLGKYLDQNGFQDKFTIMNAHLNRVIALCRKNDLEPMIWSDMYFRIKSSTGDYYDVPETMNFSESERPSEELGIIYWDYYHEEEEYYKSYLDLHKKLSKKVSFAGGGWTWNGVAPNYSKMKATTNAALAACKEKKVKEVFCTLWQDNGAETPMKTAFVGITLFAEHSFHETVSENALKERFEALWKESYETYQLLDQFDHTKGTLPNNTDGDNPSKYLLYQDVLLGLFDKQIKGLQLGEHYKKLYEAISLEETMKNYELFKYYSLLAKLLSLKAELGIQIQEAYQKKDRETLSNLSNTTLSACIKLAEELRDSREKLWFSECKPFGFEVLDIRFAGIAARLKSAKNRINQYLEGKESILMELEEERILYKKDENHQEHPLCSCNFWQDIVSAGNIAGI